MMNLNLTHIWNKIKWIILNFQYLTSLDLAKLSLVIALVKMYVLICVVNIHLNDYMHVNVHFVEFFTFVIRSF